LTALALKEIKDATEDSWTRPSNTFNKKELPLKTNTPTKESLQNADHSTPISKYLLGLMFLKTQPPNWLPP